MTAVLVVLALTALVATVAFHVGERREHHRRAADWLTVRAELDAQQAALLATPADAIEYRRAIAAHHRARYEAAKDRFDGYYLDLREAA